MAINRDDAKDIKEATGEAYTNGFFDGDEYGENNALKEMRELIATLIAECNDDNATVSTLNSLLERMPK